MGGKDAKNDTVKPISLSLGSCLVKQKPAKPPSKIFNVQKDDLPEESVRRVAVETLTEIGQEEKPLTIECSNKLEKASSARKNAPRIYDPARKGKIEWEKSEAQLEDEDALKPYGLQDSATVTGSKRPLTLLKNASQVVIGEDTKYEIEPSEYGLALLRGMGYDPARDEVPAVEPKARPPGTGGIGASQF